MNYDHIETAEHLASFCNDLKGSEFIGFDTEFVSEDTYYPELCLIQVASDDRLAVIDTKKVKDIKPFWQVLCENGHRTIVHAGREEFRFCRSACNARPSDLFDIQLAAGFVGLEYPASYAKLISKLLDIRLPKGETRTDWRKRPLSEHQIEYALKDVTYLKPIHDKIQAKLTNLKRTDWFHEEMRAWEANQEFVEAQERWRRVSGISNLPEKALVVAREIWRWRESEAQARNRPVKRILRDDFIVELSRRGTPDLSKIRAIRGIERSVSKHNLSQIAKAIATAKRIPKEDWPKSHATPTSTQATLLGQFVSVALSSICKSNELAPGIVGTIQDVRDLIRYRLHPEQFADRPQPSLARGWRASVVGQSIEKLLSGESFIRIDNVKSDNPLIIESLTDNNGKP